MESHRSHEQPSPYGRLLVMAVLSFAAMFVLMYAMVDRLPNVYPNLNQAYMAGLMAAPMVLIELFVMRGMYRNRGANMAIAATSLAAMLACYAMIRAQTAVNDREFLRSMIPHHAGAILMCEQASLRDPEVVALCEGIRASQKEEIAEMKAMLDRRPTAEAAPRGRAHAASTSR